MDIRLNAISHLVLNIVFQGSYIPFFADFIFWIFLLYGFLGFAIAQTSKGIGENLN